jgi:flagellar basal body-associated protein FliL
MAEAAPAEDGKATPSGGKGGKLAFLVVGLAAGGAGFATPYFLPANLRPGAHAAETETETDEHATDAAAAAAKPAYIDFGDAVVNLDEGRLNRYLRITLTLQIDELHKDEIEDKVEANRAVLKSWLLSYLSDKDMEDIRGAAGQNRLRREIQDHFNSVLFPDGYDRIHEVLFQEFNIQ